MSNRIRCCVAVVLFGLALATPALAIDPPHASVSGFTCSTCHTAHVTLGSVGYNNICLTCHRPGVPRGGTLPFAPADMANPFGTYTGLRLGTPYQTSHAWTGSDNVPRAGAAPPQNAVLNGLSTDGTLACSRCHDPHNNTYPPYLRLANDRDQLCLDCHRARNTTDQGRGTHPVNIAYSSAVKRNPAGYNAVPLNSNPANPTSAMRLIGGTVLCSTCHGVHYTDSNSATFDNHSSYATLKPSAGYLLRTDLRGATSSALSICNNCHKKTYHNGKGQNIQCADCHGGHVDAGDGSAPNVFLINRFINASSSFGVVRNKQVFMLYTAAAKRVYKNPDGTGICQACHVVPTGSSYPAEHSLATGTAAVCSGCHMHVSSTWSFSASGAACSTCHGYPPRTATSGGPDGMAAGYAVAGVSEATTPHRRHAGGGSDYNYACDQCHKGNSHNTGTFQDVFKSTAGSIAATAGATPTYNAATRSCANVYCHSDGAPRNSALVPVLTTKTVPAWPNGAGTITGCSACHAAQPATNAHTAHLAKGYGCVVCHADTVSDNTTIADRSKHADGQKTVVFSSTNPLAAGTLWNATTASCSASRCHSNGVAGSTGAPNTTPVWTNPATGACGSCHATSPAIAATTTQTIATGRHTSHLTTVYGVQLGTTLTACQTCHDYSTAKHVNGVVDLLPAACNGCHPQGAVWTSTTRLACTSCHAAVPSVVKGVAAPYKASFALSGHGQSGSAYNASRACESCHDANSAHISGVLGDATRLLLPDDNTQCASCHNDSTKVSTAAKQNVASHVTVKGGQSTMLCKVCHDPHGTTNLAMVRTTINGVAIAFTNLSSGFVKTAAPYNGLCQVCHSQTAHYKAGQAPDGHPTKYCLSCHSHKGTFAFQPVGGGACDSCHGYPPAPVGFVPTTGDYGAAKTEDYPGGGGAHVIGKHVPKAAVPSQGWSNCTPCHGNGSLNPATHTMVLPVTPSKVTIDVQDRYKFNSTLPLGPQQYSGKLLDGGANATGSCSNVSCHYKPSKRWSTTR
ncbi:cytochrome c [Geotalea uraniireducens]|uniref:Cytochrome c n=1 Tax=Geotalea uraniireducens TaxID=351604 RepID=A0ABN6VXT1_9BACT|nr:CxxxxCH/CxxCH domain-containing protein [Geotalea uraniireducens]BDV44294.1 cytochrome c [Geotalea uraniireducens]